MDTIPNGPLDDIKKLGEILIRRNSEKEYYRFLHLQEQCRLKWQATTDKFVQLLKEHEQCVLEKQRLIDTLQHVSSMWEMEKEDRRAAEREAQNFKQTLNHLKELLKRNGSLERGDRHEEKRSKFKIDEKSNDELTSTASFLSRLSDLTPTDEYYLEQCDGIVGSHQLSKTFDNTIFAEIHGNEHETNMSKSCATDESTKTFVVENNPNKKRDKISDESSDDIRCENSRRVPPKKRVRKYLHASKEFIREKLSIPKGRRSLDALSTAEVNPNPIYERIDSSIISLDCEKNLNYNWEKNAIAPKDNSCDLNATRRESIINPNSCTHTFTHRTASRSIICFVCSKKFRFGMAYKCISCRVFVHHDCKTHLKTTSKVRRMSKGGKHPIELFVNDYVPKDGLSVPALIVHCVNEVEMRGLSERGIYRVSGSEKEIKSLRDRFFKDDSVPDLENIDINVICGCIKMFLKGLTEPLIPTRLWAVFSNYVMDFDGDDNDGNIQKHLQHEISQLPKANRDTLAFLILHLQRVATCKEVQMPISNLSKIFGPTVVGYSSAQPDRDSILCETFIQTNVMQHFLNIPTDYWFSFISENLYA
ncbi:rac GTPase-activating protein 1-like [Contarinia nasturtii]|uniref:rac GTPase-activating protein 1-like n=1 Tax=Contarinia nasturtii TaxID=265458 RepID=UPI0012D3DB9F|nr:rac GTPase-activating protein 1-like [Contarinia nasturtii]